MFLSAEIDRSIDRSYIEGELDRLELAMTLARANGDQERYDSARRGWLGTMRESRFFGLTG